MTKRAMASLGSDDVDFQPGAPDSGSPDRGEPGGDPDDTGDPEFPFPGFDPAGIGAGSPVDADGEEDGPLFAWLPPEDRLWRHPSEGGGSGFGPAPSGPPRPGRLGRLAGAGGGGWGRTWTVALIAGLVGALSASAIGVTSGWWGHDTTVVRSVIPSTPAVSLADAGGAATNWTAIDDSVAASVVSITVEGAAGPQQGSGLVILGGPDGEAFVVTDASLFDPASGGGFEGGIEVTFLSGAVAKGRLVGQDPLSGLAVVGVANQARAVPADTGSVADLHDADPVLAVGARDVSSLSFGEVSGEDRDVDLADGSDMDGLIGVTMPSMSTTAAGGPLVDQNGLVVGVTVNIDPVDSTASQLTFAVPIDEVTRVVSDLIDQKPASHPWLGVADAADVPSMMAHQLGLSGGVQVGGIESGSPAARAGLRTDDIITSFAGQPVVSAGTLTALLEGCQPGRTVAVAYVHDGHPEQASVRLGSEPADGS